MAWVRCEDGYFPFAFISPIPLALLISHHLISANMNIHELGWHYPRRKIFHKFPFFLAAAIILGMLCELLRRKTLLRDGFESRKKRKFLDIKTRERSDGNSAIPLYMPNEMSFRLEQFLLYFGVGPAPLSPITRLPSQGDSTENKSHITFHSTEKDNATHENVENV